MRFLLFHEVWQHGPEFLHGSEGLEPGISSVSLEGAFALHLAAAPAAPC